ncbi:hypothetical protein JTB14_003376 [Gonioctena quinquepunctata]|nr:hypothetical protein JTB14_003376 [Gonioctena quinquepunctata]
MSNHCNFSVQDHNTCNDMEAWWTVITSIYNFLSALTNFAQTLDRKYASSYNPTVLHSSPLLREAPYTQNETTVEDFPWFLQLLNNDTKNVEIYSHDQIISDEQVRYYCNLHPEIIPLAKSYDEKNFLTEQSNYSSEFSISSNSNDELESTYIEEDLRSLHTSEQPITQGYIENKMEALRYLTTEKISVLEENTDESIMDNQNIKQNREEAIGSLPPEDSCCFQDSSYSEQTINSLDSHSSYKSYDRLDQIPTVIQDQQCPLLEGKPNYKNENNNEISGRSGSCGMMISTK